MRSRSLHFDHFFVLQNKLVKNAQRQSKAAKSQTMDAWQTYDLPDAYGPSISGSLYILLFLLLFVALKFMTKALPIMCRANDQL